MLRNKEVQKGCASFCFISKYVDTPIQIDFVFVLIHARNIKLLAKQICLVCKYSIVQ